MPTVLGLFFVILVTVAGLAPASDQGITPEVQGLVSSKAQDVVERYTQDGKRAQITYFVDLAYPSQVLGPAEFGALEQAGWRRCGQPAERWDRFVEAPSRTTIHQRAGYWTQDGELLTVIMRYKSAMASASERLKQPTTNRQEVVILLDRYGAQLPEVLQRLQLRC